LPINLAVFAHGCSLLFRLPSLAARGDALADCAIASVDRAAEIDGGVVGFVLRFMGRPAVLTTPNSRCDATAQKQPKCQRGPCNPGLAGGLPQHGHADYLTRSIGLPDQGLVVHSGAGLSWSAGSPLFSLRMSRVIRV